MVCGHSKLSSYRINSIPMDLSAKEKIFGGHKKNTILMIHTCLNTVLINCGEGVYLMTIKLGYSPSVILKLVEGISP